MKRINLLFKMGGGKSPLTSSILFLLAIGLAVNLVQSCKKTEAEQPTNTEASQSDNSHPSNIVSERSFNCTLLKSDIVKQNGMLVFRDRQHYEECIQCLEKEVEDYNDAYVRRYPGATAAQLDALDDLNNFNDWEPLVQFEQEKSFTSLRSVVDAQNKQWLSNQFGETINFDESPDHNCPIQSVVERSFFNVNGSVKIGNDVINMDDSDEPESIDCCAFLKQTSFTFDLNNDPYLANRQVLCRIAVESGVVVSKLVGKTEHYRKVNGVYKLRRADMRQVIGGFGMDGSNCRPSIQPWFDSNDYEYRRIRHITARIWSLWREAVVCRSSQFFPTNRCSLVSFVDNESHVYGVILANN
jgi:hypothetical protein